MQHHVENSERGVLQGNGSAHLAEIGCCRIQRKTLQRSGGDVLNLQINVGEIPALSQFNDLADIRGFQQKVGEAHDRPAADADAADMLDAIL